MTWKIFVTDIKKILFVSCVRQKKTDKKNVYELKCLYSS